MRKIHSFPKIFPIGSDFIPDLFKGEVEVTEKIDGSQFNFGRTKEGEVVMRSKGKELYFEDHEKMFSIAVDWVEQNQDKLPKNMFFYGEFLGTTNHNVLEYDRVPKGNIIIFAVMKGEGFVKNYKEIHSLAEKIGLETVPLLYQGKVKTLKELEKLLKIKSILGKELVEGIVVKNYKAPCVIGSRIFPSFGKYVRETFKERHAKDWSAKFSGKNKLLVYIESFRAEARWQKAVQHLKEQGKLVNEPKDIGILLKEIERDLFEEEADNIKKELFELFKGQITRKAKAGFPEWYKKQLLKKAFKKTT